MKLRDLMFVKSGLKADWRLGTWRPYTNRRRQKQEESVDKSRKRKRNRI